MESQQEKQSASEIVNLVFKAVVLGSLQAAVLHFLEQKALLRHEFFTPLTIGRVYGESFRYLLTHPLYLAGLLGGFWLWRTGEADVFQMTFPSNRKPLLPSSMNIPLFGAPTENGPRRMSWITLPRMTVPGCKPSV